MASHTSLYAALLMVLYFFLSIRVIQRRRKAKVALGDGGDEALRRAQRVQANFAEYTPFAILLFALLELQGVPVWSIHLLALPFTLGRFLHAWGVSQTAENYRWRVLGMQCTFFPMMTAAISLVIVFVWRLLS